MKRNPGDAFRRQKEENNCWRDMWEIHSDDKFENWKSEDQIRRHIRYADDTDELKKKTRKINAEDTHREYRSGREVRKTDWEEEP